MKMLRILLVSCLVACCVAKDPVSHCCSADDRHIVQKQWQTLFDYMEHSSKLKIEFGEILLLRLAEAKPEVKEAFKRVNIEHPESGEFASHSVRILDSLDMIINMLDHPAAVKEALEHLAHQHHGRAGVKKEHFKLFGQLLINEELPRVLDEYDVMSWKACMKGILDMISAEVPA